MDRLISEQKAIEAINDYWGEMEIPTIDGYINAIKAIPSAEPRYCDRNICLRNEYNSIGCNECEVTKSQESNTVIGTGDGAYYRIKSLQAQADGEYISRKAVLSILADHFDNPFDMVRDLPSVAIPPEHDGCKDCKYETYPEYYYPCCECKQNYKDEWERAKIGHWIWQTEDIYQCSECGEDIHVKEVMNEPQYICCPMCGCPMGVEHE